MYPFYTLVHCLELVTRLHLAVKRVGVRLAQSVSSTFLGTRWVYNKYDPNLDLNVRSLLPCHHFCQNDFLCVLISVEHYVYHSEEEGIFSRSVPLANLKMGWLHVGNWPSLMHTLPIVCAVLLASSLHCTEGVNESGEPLVVAEFPLWYEILSKAKNLLRYVMWDTLNKSVIGMCRTFPWQRYL